MNLQTPDSTTDNTPADEPEPGLSRIFLRCLLQALAATIPAGTGPASATAEAWAEQWDAARELFDAMQPRNPIEAVLAARAVAAHHASMDMYARAAVPGTTDEKALRLCASAAAASRSFDTALRMLEKRQAKPRDAAGKPASKRPPAPARAAQQPAVAEPPTPPAPIPHVELFQPRDKFGQPIPAWRYEWMTPAQRRAAYCYPRNPELEAAAIAEEEAMIAEHALGSEARGQKAEDAAQQAADPDAAPGAS